MKKALVFGLIGLLICGMVYAQDHTITITIPEAKVQTALTGFLKIYPNSETISDPEWVDPEDGSVAPQILKYTNKQWVTEAVRRLIVRDIRRGLQVIANQEAQVIKDDGIAVTP